MRRTIILAALLATLLALPLGVYASHQFNDVPDSHTFHNSIDWMKDNNITVGCNPPANSQYCPDDNVTRGQMAAFMKRLADNQVVDARALDGKVPSFYQGSVAGANINNVTSAAATNLLISRVQGFQVPQNGGALAMSADVSMIAAAPGVVFIWIEVDGPATCDFASAPQTAAVHDFITENVAFLGTSTTDAISAGAHRIDLCAITEAAGVDFGLGAFTVEWVETTQIGTTASESTGLSPQELFEELSSNQGFGG